MKIEAPTKRKNNKPNWFVDSLKKAWGLYLFITAVTGASLWGVFQSKIELTTGFSIDKTNPFQTYISIHNANDYFSIYNVSPVMEVDSISFKGGEAIVNMSLNSLSLSHKEIKANNIYSFVFPVVATKNPKDKVIKSARVAYRIDYEFLWIQKSEKFNFLCVPNVDGEFEWQRMPSD